MAPKIEEDWSDSDEDTSGEVETSVLLGIPDGPVDTPSDITDAAVSRIGGHPAFLTTEPPLSASQCKNCSYPMELLVQMWCPFEDSPMDRALYVWGCQRGPCQRKDGSVRAWRGLRYNDEYASKLEKKLARRKPEEKAAPKSNPFSMQPSAASPFGLGSQIFGGAPPLSSGDDDDDEPSDTESDVSSLVTALASTTLSSPWLAAPAYPPLYLSTSPEYIPPPPLPAATQLQDPASDDTPSASWPAEAYENSLDIDPVFARFTARVGSEGAQCVRYELHGTPLPFASDAVFDALFPAPPRDPLPVTKADFKVVPPLKRTYAPASVPRCAQCGAPRVFECQLMPNLINVLWGSAGPEPLTDEERRKAVELAVKGEERRGMEWGTCLVFSCEKDCRGALRECWREEAVLIQWDE